MSSKNNGDMIPVEGVWFATYLSCFDNSNKKMILSYFKLFTNFNGKTYTSPEGPLDKFDLYKMKYKKTFSETKPT